MSTRQISDTIDVLQTTYGPNGQTRPVVAMPGRVGSFRRKHAPARPVRPDAHDSPRASYISLDETEYSTSTMDTYPRAPPQAARGPPQAARPLDPRAVDPRVVDPRSATPRSNNRSSSNPSVVSFLNQNGFPQRQPSTTLTSRSTPDSEVSLDRGYFNSYIPYPDHKDPARYNGLSWHVNKSMFVGGLKDIPERMSTRFSRRSLPTADSDMPFIKGGSAFDRSVEDLTLMGRARKISLTTILLTVAAAIFVIEECVMGAVWAFVLSKRANGMNAFARGYFGSKAMNFVGSVIAALIGLTIQWFLHAKLARSRIALQIWSFILIFLTYMGCCIASGVVSRLEG